MGKTLEDLKKSRERRQEILDKYGEVPKSIWEIDYSVGRNIIEYDGRKQHTIALEKHKKMDYDKSLHNEFSVSSQNVRGKDGGLSTFPPDLVKRVLQYYTDHFETVLDPCAGHNSRMQATYLLQRNYIGYDVSKEFMNFNRDVQKEITEELFSFQEHPFIILREQSSEKLLEGDNSMDLIFTSPPYYSVEWYGDEPEQLGKEATYEGFLNRMETIIRESYRVLKPERFCVFNINDFRLNGIFYPYHADIIKLYQKVGYKLWDVIIIKWKSAIGACFASQVEDRKVTAKSHEYLIVGKK